VDIVAAAPQRRGRDFRANRQRALGGDRNRSQAQFAALRIAMLAPPWIPVPASGYGGVETVVSALTEALVEHGHDVTLLCAPGSRSSAHTVHLLDEAHPDEIERSLHEADHVARAFALIERGAFDVVHDHCGFTALAFADRLATPLVHTLHGQFTPSTAAFYAQHGHKASIVAISRTQIECAPPAVDVVAAIPNPIDLKAWSLVERKGDYLLWIGRMTEVKGPHRAIAAARVAGMPLILAGVIQPGQQAFFDREIAPHLDGESVRFVGEVSGGSKHALFANARALLMPIRWDEPFGMVMVEALACGTPVIAFPEGAARDLVVHGRTGFLVANEVAMGAAVDQLDSIAPATCRAWVAEHCDVEVVSRAYEQVFRDAIAPRAEPRAVHA
jgi:glycosyltransferase involved in cell wall biosynthesis